MSAAIQITVNGRQHAVGSGCTISTLLAAKMFNPACADVVLSKEFLAL
jgi:hypothetical protein